MLRELWEKDPEFNILPIEEKGLILRNYFDRDMVDDEFNTLPLGEQGRVRSNFLRSEGVESEDVFSGEQIGLPFPTEERGPVGEIASSLGAGILAAGESAFGTFEMLAPPIQKQIYGLYRKGLQEAGEQEAFQRPEYLQEGTILDHPERIKDLRWWTRSLGENLPMMAAMMVPGMTMARGAKLAGLGMKAIRNYGRLGALSGAFTVEAGSAYNQAKKDMKEEGGYRPDEIERVATLEGLAVGAFNSVLEVLPFEHLMSSGHKQFLVRLIRQGFIEGTTEGIQEGINIIAESLGHLESWPSTWEAAGRILESIIVGFVLGGGVGAAIPGEGKLEQKQPPPPVELTPDQKQGVLNKVAADLIEGNISANDVEAVKADIPDLAPQIDELLESHLQADPYELAYRRNQAIGIIQAEAPKPIEPVIPETAFDKLKKALKGKKGRKVSVKKLEKALEDKEFKAWAVKAQDRKVSEEEYEEALKFIQREDEDESFREWQIKAQKSYAGEKEVVPDETEVRKKEREEGEREVEKKPVTIPELKPEEDTAVQAYEFSKIATPEQLEEVERLEKQYDKEGAETKDLQEKMALAIKGQYMREIQRAKREPEAFEKHLEKPGAAVGGEPVEKAEEISVEPKKKATPTAAPIEKEKALEVGVPKEIEKGIQKIEKLDTKRREFNAKYDAILETSGVGQTPPIAGETLDKAIKVSEQQAEIWNDLRNYIVDKKTGKTLWQIATDSEALITTKTGKEERLDFYGADIRKAINDYFKKKPKPQPQQPKTEKAEELPPEEADRAEATPKREELAPKEEEAKAPEPKYTPDQLKSVTVKVEAIRETTGEKITVEDNAFDALNENKAKRSLYQELLDCLKR